MNLTVMVFVQCVCESTVNALTEKATGGRHILFVGVWQGEVQMKSYILCYYYCLSDTVFFPQELHTML